MELVQEAKIGDVLSMEADDSYSREVATIASGQGELTVGAVLGVITASGKYAHSDLTATDGSEVAKAVLLDNVDATSGDITARVLVRHATVKAHGLNFHASVDNATKRQGQIDELKAAGIVTRQGS